MVNVPGFSLKAAYMFQQARAASTTEVASPVRNSAKLLRIGKQDHQQLVPFNPIQIKITLSDIRPRFATHPKRIELLLVRNKMELFQ